ncbi:MAG: anti-sigma regulatory factor [Deltaproteobacteria bacterium HGW-Deltaproteobacteria-12]|jgi:anti-sigma regulatory factor (Ser/Thr protein kinase)|nr:MAG: anti-sigma regulatory factor [Deltaproteobacteria bacterium HGW-Deltaproteobacteria-12]
MSETDHTAYKRSFYIEGGNFNYAGIVSTSIKSILKQMDFSGDVIRKCAIVCYESEINVVSYARKGVVNLMIDPDSIKIEVVDEGPGIPNIDLAMQQGYSTADQRIREMGFGAGMGLHNIKSYSDAFIISSELGKGTRLLMTINIKQ